MEPALKPARSETMIDITNVSLVYMMRARVLPGMVKRESWSDINIGSNARQLAVCRCNAVIAHGKRFVRRQPESAYGPVHSSRRVTDIETGSGGGTEFFQWSRS